MKNKTRRKVFFGNKNVSRIQYSIFATKDWLNSVSHIEFAKILLNSGLFDNNPYNYDQIIPSVYEKNASIPSSPIFGKKYIYIGFFNIYIC